ncbi:MAG: sterol desaturase family protein [Acidimicrobiales bacterium]
MPVERIWRRHDFGVRRPGLRTDAFHFLFTGALQTAALVVAVVICMLPLWPLLGNPVAQGFQQLPGALQAVLALVTFELFGYWYHRLSHEWAFLWRFHAVHHSSERLDWIAAARLHPLEGFFAGLVVGPPLLLLGVRPTTLGVLGVVTQLWAVTLHMNVRWRMRALDGIWGTPEYHHWHHSNEPDARNRNYSGLLPVLDLIFGTYFMPKERRPQVYGIDDPMPEGYLAQLAQPFRRGHPKAPESPPPVTARGSAPPTTGWTPGPGPAGPLPPSAWVPPGASTGAGHPGWRPEPWARL